MSSPNVNDQFFDGHYKTIWKELIPEQLTQKELDFMVPYFGLQPGDSVLDLMCGHGRHALGLARRGMNVLAVDNLADYLEEIKATAQQEGLPVTTLQTSVTELTTGGDHALAICMGNSLQFFSPEELSGILGMVSGSLRKGGYFLVNSWSIAEISKRNFKENVSTPMGNYQFDCASAWKEDPTRIEMKIRITAPDGSVEEKESVDYIYSLPELEKLFAAAGMQMKEVFSIPGRKHFAEGEPRAYIIAQKA